jgi:hypothetical protein
LLGTEPRGVEPRGVEPRGVEPRGVGRCAEGVVRLPVEILAA